MNETAKLNLKRALYIQNSYRLCKDSVTGEIINIDFAMLDKGIIPKFKRLRKSRVNVPTREDNLIMGLKKGNKIKLGVY